MNAKRHGSSRRRVRRGSLTVELLLILPILFAVLLAVVQFSLLITAEQRLAEASARAARVAAQGGDPEEIHRAALEVLGKGSLAKAEVKALLNDKEGNPLPSGGTIEVIVVLQAKKAVPDLLAFIGISLGDSEIIGRTAMRKE